MSDLGIAHPPEAAPMNGQPMSQQQVRDPEFLYEGDDSFRDSLGTVGPDGKRKWVYAKPTPGGKLWRARQWVYYILIGILIAMPLIEVDGHPFMLFNVLKRKFIVFGQVFWPQDMFLFAMGTITAIVGIGLFTLAYGRLFCGWICPQTVFMEGVFRRLDRLFEGSAEQQRKMDAAPWTTQKMLRKGLQHAFYFGLAFLIGNIFLMYLVGKQELWHIVTDDPRNHIPSLILMLGFSLLTWFNFARFREQTCLVICPYGRLQGVLLDANSIVVAYDWRRGEPRTKLKKSATESEKAAAGDCIDCYECVRVCPTAIDIRNGTQLECVNCTACIDACNTVMDKVGKPRDLVKYASRNQIAEGKQFRFTGRMMWLSAVMILMGTTLTVLTITRDDVATTLVRLPGVRFQQLANGQISNTYKFQLTNKTFHPKQIRFELLAPKDGTLLLSGSSEGHFDVPSEGFKEGLLLVQLNPAELTGFKSEIQIVVYDGDKRIRTIKTSFLGPFGASGVR